MAFVYTMQLLLVVPFCRLPSWPPASGDPGVRDETGTSFHEAVVSVGSAVPKQSLRTTTPLLPSSLSPLFLSFLLRHVLLWLPACDFEVPTVSKLTLPKPRKTNGPSFPLLQSMQIPVGILHDATTSLLANAISPGLFCITLRKKASPYSARFVSRL